MSRCFVSLLALAVAIPSSVHAQDATSEFRKLAADYAAACTQGDARATAALYTADAVWIDASDASGIARTVTRGAIEKQLAASFAGPSKGAKCAIGVSTVRFPKPDVALGEGTYTIEVPGQPPLKGLWINVAIRQGGKWLIAHDMGAASK